MPAMTHSIPDAAAGSGAAHDLQQRRTAQQERLNILAARRHVGAAGLAQTEALEELIALGREQIEISAALREVATLTVGEVRDQSLSGLQSASPKHADMLRAVVQSSREQLEQANVLGDLVQDALTQVQRIPPEQVSAAALRQIQAQVRRQVEALEQLLRVAEAHVQTVEQVADLEQVRTGLHDKLEQIERAEAQDKLRAFEQLSEGAVASILSVEHADDRDRARALRQLIAAAETQLARLEDHLRD